MAQDDDHDYFAPDWEALKRDLRASALLRERYPELVAGDEEPSRSLTEFDFVLSIALGIREDRVVAKWSMSGRYADAFARRLYADTRLRARVAEAIGEEISGFDQKASALSLRGGRLPARLPLAARRRAATARTGRGHGGSAARAALSQGDLGSGGVAASQAEHRWALAPNAAAPGRRGRSRGVVNPQHRTASRGGGGDRHATEADSRPPGLQRSAGP